MWLRANPDKHRFIPTPVGNTCAEHKMAATLSVHPHARGEHDNEHARQALRIGSSPRPWGTLCWP